MFLLQACRFTKRNENSIANSSNLLRVYVIIEFGVLNLEMDYQYKNGGGVGGNRVLPPGSEPNTSMAIKV